MFYFISVSITVAVIFESLLLCVKDMNEPASFVDGTVGGKCLGDPIYDDPPYMPRKIRFLSLFFTA